MSSPSKLPSPKRMGYALVNHVSRIMGGDCEYVSPQPNAAVAVAASVEKAPDGAEVDLVYEVSVGILPRVRRRYAHFVILHARLRAETPAFRAALPQTAPARHDRDVAERGFAASRTADLTLRQRTTRLGVYLAAVLKVAAASEALGAFLDHATGPWERIGALGSAGIDMTVEDEADDAPTAAAVAEALEAAADARADAAALEAGRAACAAGAVGARAAALARADAALAAATEHRDRLSVLRVSERSVVDERSAERASDRAFDGRRPCGSVIAAPPAAILDAGGGGGGGAGADSGADDPAGDADGAADVAAPPEATPAEAVAAAGATVAVAEAAAMSGVLRLCDGDSRVASAWAAAGAAAEAAAAAADCAQRLEGRARRAAVAAAAADGAAAAAVYDVAVARAAADAARARADDSVSRRVAAAADADAAAVALAETLGDRSGAARRCLVEARGLRRLADAHGRSVRDLEARDLADSAAALASRAAWNPNRFKIPQLACSGTNI